MVKKVKLMDRMTMMRSLTRISHEIIEKNGGTDSLRILGIKNRGSVLSHILADNLKMIGGVEVPCGEIDTTMYRDDFTPEEKRLKATESLIPFDVTDKTVIIVDDVLYTGRTARRISVDASTVKSASICKKQSQKSFRSNLFSEGIHLTFFRGA